ncbi:hypothetical protein [Maribacter sp. 2307ULW6-5]|uniref:hypothetical protein n=1 Tax=Maribacter sp. 2307ULW6-5 TaxID=3386275 RepID=UPI0039BCA092
MRKLIVILSLGMLTFASCSTDGENETDTNAIVGTWVVTDFALNGFDASDDARFGQQIIRNLASRDCYIINLQFNEDGTVVARSSGAYLEINATATGLDVPCPTESDVENSTYTFDGSVLSILDENGETISTRVNIDGAEMRINAADLEIDEFDEAGELVFTRQ